MLIVDDEEVFSELAREQLERRGFSVEIAASGEEALPRIQARPPRAIVMDVRMPGMGGVALLRRLQADPATRPIPVIVCSCTASETAAAQGLLGLGARRVLGKPCEPEALARALRQAMAGEGGDAG